jgi:hypothetical protein
MSFGIYNNLAWSIVVTAGLVVEFGLESIDFRVCVRWAVELM